MDDIRDAGGRIPPHQNCFALIDTGASRTCIDERFARSLQLTQWEPVQIKTLAGLSIRAQYRARLGIGSTHYDITMAGADLASQGLDALIGTDVLSDCVLVYSGVSGQFTLSF
jgi:hypothetical protein